MKDKRLYTFRDSGFFVPMIKKAELVEQKRFIELYNKIHRTHYTAKELVYTLGEMTGNPDYWKRMYVDNLNGLHELDIATNEDLMNEAMDFLGTLYQDIARKSDDIGLALINANFVTDPKTKVEFINKAKQNTVFKQGLEREADLALKRFKELKAIDFNTKFTESEGSWRLELKGDYRWNFPNSSIVHWNEVKTSLSKFHITGSGTAIVLEPLIKGSNITERNNKLIVSFTAESLDQQCQKLLTRKYSDNGAYPIYEDGNLTLLSSELFQYFATDGIDLYQVPGGNIEIDGTQAKLYNIEDRDHLEMVVRDIFNKKKIKADLWYGR